MNTVYITLLNELAGAEARYKRMIEIATYRQPTTIKTAKMVERRINSLKLKIESMRGSMK